MVEEYILLTNYNINCTIYILYRFKMRIYISYVVIVLLCLFMTVLCAHDHDSISSYRQRSIQNNGNSDNGKKCRDKLDIFEARTTRSALQEKLLYDLYNTIVWPLGADAVYQASTTGNLTVPLKFFDPTAIINLPPIGSFTGPLSIIEYYWGLSGPLYPGDPMSQRVTSVKMTHASCWNNTCSFQALINFKDFATNSSVSNYTHHGSVFFNSNNKICGGQINFVNAAWQDANTEDPNVKAYINYLTCTTTMAQCTGANQQYASYNVCMAFMATKVYGGFYRTGEDTVICRYLHTSLQRISPAAATRHCPHSGPSGGGKCIPKDGAFYYSDSITEYDSCKDPNF